MRKTVSMPCGKQQERQITVSNDDSVNDKLGGLIGGLFRKSQEKKKPEDTNGYNNHF